MCGGIQVMRIYDNGIYRDATAEEITEMQIQHAEMLESENSITLEERLDNVEQRTHELETVSDDIILMMADLIGGM